MTILIFNRTSAKNYINVSNNVSIFEYYDAIKYGRARSNISLWPLGFIGFDHVPTKIITS